MGVAKGLICVGPSQILTLQVYFDILVTALDGGADLPIRTKLAHRDKGSNLVVLNRYYAVPALYNQQNPQKMFFRLSTCLPCILVYAVRMLSEIRRRNNNY